jgi:hypothetical protein
MLLIAAISCGDETQPVLPPDGSCEAVELPVTGESNAPVITDVALEVQTSVIVVLATATDPQGTDNLRDVLQIIRVFQDPLCETSPIVLQDDLVGSGVEESFGTAVESSNQPLFSTISASATWPIELEFRDADDNLTTGRVLARVEH